jgi:PIN domain nuclease of toxin-antitoxin system
MKYLLDTHTFIWMDNEPEKLSSSAHNAIRGLENSAFLSLASIWEMQIKLQAGRLRLRTSLAQIIQDQRRNGIELLSISLPHILALGELADHHRDPFDRILIAQARVEDLTLITRDPSIAQYTVPTLW